MPRMAGAASAASASEAPPSNAARPRPRRPPPCRARSAASRRPSRRASGEHCVPRSAVPTGGAAAIAASSAIAAHPRLPDARGAAAARGRRARRTRRARARAQQCLVVLVLVRNPSRSRPSRRRGWRARRRTRARARRPARTPPRAHGRAATSVSSPLRRDPPRESSRERRAINRAISRSNRLSCSRDGFPREHHRGRTASKGASRRGPHGRAARSRPEWLPHGAVRRACSCRPSIESGPPSRVEREKPASKFAPKCGEPATGRPARAGGGRAPQRGQRRAGHTERGCASEHAATLRCARAGRHSRASAGRTRGEPSRGQRGVHAGRASFSRRGRRTRRPAPYRSRWRRPRGDGGRSRPVQSTVWTAHDKVPMGPGPRSRTAGRAGEGHCPAARAWPASRRAEERGGREALDSQPASCCCSHGWSSRSQPLPRDFRC